jgi:heme-degrading monooxygenase HmoA
VITEHALLPVVPGREEAFEAALREAVAIIGAARGFRGLSVTRGVERPSTYLLVVEWDSLEDHTEGFRGSPAYDEWRALLHSFYDPFPVVQHFTPVLTHP